MANLIFKFSYYDCCMLMHWNIFPYYIRNHTVTKSKLSKSKYEWCVWQSGRTTDVIISTEFEDVMGNTINRRGQIMKEKNTTIQQIYVRC
jgi:hypothetical protein